jgi:elongator complex protein 6
MKALDNLAEGSRALLILDSPDILLSLTSTPNSAVSLSSAIFDLRRHPSVHSTVASLSTSLAYPFSTLNGGNGGTDVLRQPTELDTQVRAFMAATAHSADLVLGIRPLDTGSAVDVSGVIRVTQGANTDDSEEDEAGASATIREGEWLYFVKGDGTVRVWERKAGVG